MSALALSSPPTKERGHVRRSSVVQFRLGVWVTWVVSGERRQQCVSHAKILLCPPPAADPSCPGGLRDVGLCHNVSLTLSCLSGTWHSPAGQLTAAVSDRCDNSKRRACVEQSTQIRQYALAVRLMTWLVDAMQKLVPESMVLIRYCIIGRGACLVIRMLNWDSICFSCRC